VLTYVSNLNFLIEFRALQPEMWIQMWDSEFKMDQFLYKKVLGVEKP
jgi:hypothetical protein